METYQWPTEQAGLCLADLGSCQKSLARLSLLTCKGMTGRGQSPLLYRKKGPESLRGGGKEEIKRKEGRVERKKRSINQKIIELEYGKK